MSFTSVKSTTTATSDIKAEVKTRAGKFLGSVYGFNPAMKKFMKNQGYEVEYRAVCGTDGVYGYLVVKDVNGVEIGKRQFTDNTNNGKWAIYGLKLKNSYISYSYADVADSLLKIVFTDYLEKQGVYDSDAGFIDVKEADSEDTTATAVEEEEIPA